MSEILPLLPGNVYQYIDKLAVEITYKDGRKARIDGTDVRLEASVEVAWHASADLQDLPVTMTALHDVPKVHLTITPMRREGSDLSVTPHVQEESG